MNNAALALPSLPVRRSDWRTVRLDEVADLCLGKMLDPKKNRGQPLPNVTFPDTIIAARIDRETIEQRFLQYFWNSCFVRRQIQSAARTTNGTFKVNQSMVEAILLVAPLDLQRQFSFRVAEIENLIKKLGAFCDGADSLFAWLQQRAFTGEL